MKNLVVYSLLILLIAACVCTAEDEEAKSGIIDKTLGGVGKAADKGASAVNKVTNKSASVINKAADKTASVINKASDKTASVVKEIRTPEPHEHGKGKLLPSAYSGASNLVKTVTDEVGNVVKTVYSGVRNTGRAVGQTAKYSALRLIPSRIKDRLASKRE